MALATFLSVGWDAFLLGLALMGLAWVYSAPPMRTKRMYFVSTLTIGLIALFCQYLGASPWLMGQTLLVYPSDVALATVLGVALAFNVKDVEDEKGDRVFGVFTNYTVFGMRLGRVLSGVFMLLAYVLIPLVLRLPEALYVAVPVGLLAGFIASRPRFYENVLWGLFFLFLLPVAYMYLKRGVRPNFELSLRTYNHGNYAVMAFREEGIERGERVLDSLLRVLPCDERLLVMKLELLKNTRPKDALEFFGDVRRRCRIDGRILSVMAETHLKLGEHERALELAREALKVGEVGAYRVLARVYYEKGMLYRATRYANLYRKYVKVRP